MSFSQLETALITTLTALAVGILVNWLSGRTHVSCDDCEKRHQAVNEQLNNIKDKDHSDHAMMLRMLRSIVTNMEISNEKKEAILNDTGGSK
jgi:hypothetical protein